MKYIVKYLQIHIQKGTYCLGQRIKIIYLFFKSLLVSLKFLKIIEGVGVLFSPHEKIILKSYCGSPVKLNKFVIEKFSQFKILLFI